MELRCPRCSSQALADQAGSSALGDAPCPACHGTFLPPEGVECLVHRELGIEVSTLRELMGPHAGTQLKCPSCSFALSHVQLKGVGLELCTGCGGLWLDEGELERLSEGRYTYTPPPASTDVDVHEATSVAEPSFTAAERELESVPRSRPGRLGCAGVAAMLYAGGFGVGMLLTALSLGSWSLGLVGLGGLGVAAMILFTPRERGAAQLAAPGPPKDSSESDDVSDTETTDVSPPGPSAARPGTPSARS